MEKMILTLKNLYMTLMTDDFPIYSESVIGRVERKGQTMLRFWQGQIVSEFRCLPCGKMIWKDDGKRNRYTSYLCNRSAEIKTYSEYARELASQIRVSSLINQINQFSEFLSGRKYRHDILLRRIQELVRLTRVDDPRVSAAIANQIGRAIAWKSGSAQGNLFQASYLLTLLMLYAAAGEAMDDPVMAVLRAEAHSVEQLWAAYNRPQEKKADAAVFLTIHSGLLQDNPLPQHRFFGREEELFDLKEFVATNRKCLITGMGGIGKTELLRQLLCRCAEDHTVDKIAVVPYDIGIMESFARSFPGFQRQNPEDSFQKILHLLKKESAGSKLLLLIDNLTKGTEEDPELSVLGDLDCAVVITSRRNALEGFETFPLSDPTIATSTLIFRDNYDRPLSREDQAILANMLADEELRHPLTMRLMARAAGSKKWSVGMLKEQLDKHGATFSWQEKERTIRIQKLYRQLYSYLDIPKECRKMAELFTLLPRDTYAGEFLDQYFPHITQGSAAQKVKILAEGGWLESNDDGYSMHPLVAQCLRRTVLNEKVTEPFLRRIRQRLLEMGAVDAPEPEGDDFLRLCQIYIHIVGLLGGFVSADIVRAFANAAAVSEHTDQTLDRREKLLKKLKKRCSDMDDSAEGAYWRTLCRWRRGDTEAVKQLYQRQKMQRTVPEVLYHDFCLAGGYFLKYQQETALAEEMLLGVLQNSTEPVQFATAYFYMYELTQVTGDYAASARWGSEGAAYVKAHPECGGELTFTNLFAMGAGNLKFRKEDAREALDEMEKLLTEDSPDWCKAQYAALAGTWELLYGSPEAALEHFLWQRNHILEYQGRCYSYYNTLGQIGQVLRRLGRLEEALETCKEILNFARENGHGALGQRIGCNLAGICLDMKKPEDALVYLHDAVEEGRQSGGLPLGEALWSTAQAHRQLGDTEQEYHCLKEAVPLLEEAYGTEHPKVQAARERLETVKEDK